MEKSAVKRRFYIYGFKILGGNILQHLKKYFN